MSRHRNVRGMDYEEEYEGYDDVYGHSVEDDCVSPTDASQWMFDRVRGEASMSEFLANNADIQEGDEDMENDEAAAKQRRDSEDYEFPELNELDKAKLLSCMEEIRNIMGDSISDKKLVEAIMSFDYDCPKALDFVLKEPAKSSSSTVRVSKLSTAPIEKDLKPLKDINVNTFNGKPANSEIKIEPEFTSLNELTKYHLEQNSFGKTKQFSIPKLQRSEGGFFIPQLNFGGNFEEPKTSGLLDLSKLQLRSENSPKSSQFVIPNLFGTGNATLSSSPALGNNFPNLFNKTEIVTKDSIESEKWVIDLKSALVSDPAPKNILVQKQLPKVPQFVPQFIDCENVKTFSPKEFQLDDHCGLLLRSVLDKTYKANKLVKFSSVGKIISKKFRKRAVPFVSHAFVHKHVVVAFEFNVESPDDQRLKHLNKKK